MTEMHDLTQLPPTKALLHGFDLPEEPRTAVLDLRGGRSLAHSRGASDGAQARQGFCVGTLNLMVRYIDGSELTDLPKVHRLPNAPRWMLGMANLHGALVPVFDPALWLGVRRAEGAKPMLLVLGHGRDAAGWVVDGLPQRLRFSASDLSPDVKFPQALAVAAQRTVLIGEHVWIDLDCAALLAEVERLLEGSP